MADLTKPAAQAEFATIVGITQPQVADLVRRAVLRPGDSLGEWLHAYCGHLRLIAAGRAEPAEVTAERVALLRARRETAELELQRKRGKLVDAEEMERAASLSGARAETRFNRGPHESRHWWLPSRPRTCVRGFSPPSVRACARTWRPCRRNSASSGPPMSDDGCIDRDLAELIYRQVQARLVEIARGINAAALDKLRAGLPIEQALQEAAAAAAAQVDQAEAEARLAIQAAIVATALGRSQ
jgi:hypothetical protein